MLDELEAWVGVGLQSAEVLIDAQTVIVHRLLGFAGLEPLAECEPVRMVTEKAPAFIAAGGAAVYAMLTLQRPDQIAEAALEPIRVRTRANACRLTKAARMAV